MSTENAESIGTVEAYVIDARQHRITALRLAKVGGDAAFLSWADLRFGSDAVIVSSSDRLKPPRDDIEARAGSKQLQPIGKLGARRSGQRAGEGRGS